MFQTFIPGQPIQQGSMIPRLVWVGGKPKATMHSHASAALKAWRTRIGLLVRKHGRVGSEVQPIAVTATFYLERPATSKFGDYPAGPPDLDKLARAALDALTQAGTIQDDARVTRLVVEKAWAGERGPGMMLEVQAL